MTFDVTPDDDSEYQADYEIDDQNAVKDIVEYSRSRQVLNEEQTIVTVLIYCGGWLPSWKDFNAGLITGGSAGGKSHMKQEVADDMFALIDDALYNPTGMSPSAIIDDERWDEAKVGALNELQKIPDKMLNFLKSAHGDDGGFDYRRDVADSDADSGFSAAKIERDPKPVVAMLADENSFNVEQELRTRMMEIKVDESEEKNEAVHKMKWGHDHITLPSTDQEYVYHDRDLWHAVRAHIRDMAEAADQYDRVLLPTGDGRFSGDDWDAGHVTQPLFNFKRSEATRASDMLASLVKSSALLNYHARDTVELNGETCLVAEPHDVANILFCRRTLLATTHGLTEKKFAVLDAILNRGGRADATGTAVQATKQDVIDEVQDNPDIATMKKSEITEILDELDEYLIINKKDNPEDRRQNLYVYDGGAVFDAPNIWDYPDKFGDITDPIRDQSLEATIQEQLQELNARMDTMEASEGADADAEGLDAFDSGGPSDLDETEQRVAEAVSDTLDGKTVPASVVEENSLKLSHMVGATPIEEIDDGWIRPEREPRGDDRIGTLMDPDQWPDADDFNEVEKEIEQAIAALKEAGVLIMEPTDDGAMEVEVEL